MQKQREIRREIISITIKPELAQQAMAIAIERGVSRSAFISELVQRAVQRADPGQQSEGQ